jgi:drug/metabolite transporter (DMT)-like permease
MSKVAKAHIALFLVALIYGANYSIAKLVLDDNYILPFGFIVFRILSGVGLFWFFHLVFVREKIKKEDIPMLFLCAFFGVALNQMCFFTGLKYTTPINASLIMTTTPILVLVASAILIKEKITVQKLIGIVIGAFGAIILISKGGSFSLQRDQLLGDALIFINAISYGVYLVLVKKLMKRYHPITVVKWVFTFSIIIVLPFGWNDVKTIEWSTFTPVIWFSFVYVLIAVTFLTYLLNAFALKIVNPSVTSIYIYFQPLFASFIALTFGKDELNIINILAGMLIFIGVFLVSKENSIFQNE